MHIGKAGLYRYKDLYRYMGIGYIYRYILKSCRIKGISVIFGIPCKGEYLRVSIPFGE
jgi:hypothetical protein